MTPNIIQETSQGLSHIPLQDALFQKREIYCIGNITSEQVYSLVMQLRWLQHDSPSAEITLFLPLLLTPPGTAALAGRKDRIPLPNSAAATGTGA